MGGNDFLDEEFVLDKLRNHLQAMGIGEQDLDEQLRKLSCFSGRLVERAVTDVEADADLAVLAAQADLDVDVEGFFGAGIALPLAPGLAAIEDGVESQAEGPW